MAFYFISIVLLGFIAVYALMAVWAERKISAWIQDRVGPVVTGKYGLLQTFADIFKMLQKEDITPTLADKKLFLAAPILVFTAVFMGFATIPFSPTYISSSINIGIFYLLAIVSIEVLGILMAGWASNNKYALLGSIRSIAQIISYEIPAALAILSVIMLFQTLNLQEICMQQGILSKQKLYFFGFWEVSKIGGVFAWTIFQAPHLLIAFIIYFIASLAECNRTPFDIPEAESELVAGFHVEYTGFKFGALFLAEYAMMFLVSMIAAVLFFGGWNTPLPNLDSFALADYTTGTYWGVVWILLKALSLVLLQVWIRWTFPRYRMDQLMTLCWKVLIPLSFVLVLFSGIWKLFILN
jgi:NADH-quinone oxidoreductase subunit H